MLLQLISLFTLHDLLLLCCFTGDENIKSSRLQDQAYVEHTESGNVVCGFHHAGGTRCGSKLRVVDTTHPQTVGIFTMICEHTMNKPIAELHGSTFKTQFWSDGDFALNVSAVTAEFVTGGSETQMNERRRLLKMATVSSSFHLVGLTEGPACSVTVFLSETMVRSLRSTSASLRATERCSISRHL